MKIVLLSDTHGQRVKNLPQEADILIHTGDWSGSGTYEETRDFIKWLAQLRHRYDCVVVVPGNHDRWVEANQARAKREFADHDIHLLIHDFTEHKGRKIYGYPTTPIFNRWAFMGDDAVRRATAAQIPPDTFILASHGPPLGYLDKLSDSGSIPGANAGCEHLLAAVLRTKPELHTFGHIHEGAGITTLNDGKTLLVNCSHMDEQYTPTNAFKVVHLP